MIRRLPPELISQIAAGEVVERPASVVKELVDNAIDAGARSIEVVLKAGGRELIAVSDDGCGMGPEDVRLAFEHHATSKLASLADLERIVTLGFRGEALPSIAAVANVRVVTATNGAASGSELVVERGRVRRAGEIGRPPGTTVEVSQLFQHTPARRKFLRAPSTELAKIQEIIMQQALVSPSVAFRLLHHGRSVLHAPAAATLNERAAQLFGLEWARQLLVIDGRGEGLSLRGLVSPPPLSWPHRRFQYWSVNRRPIRSQLLTHALYDGYLPFLRRGQHPAALLQVELDPAKVDVNIHPSKLEVRFAQPHLVHALVRETVAERINGSPSAATADAVPDAQRSSPGTTAAWMTRTWPPDVLVRDAAADYGRPADQPAPASSVSLLPDPIIEPLGQLYHTYLVAVVDGELQLIDQHAAHERLLFDELIEQLTSAATDRPAAQPRRGPQTLHLPADVVTLLSAHLPLLASLGVECEPFGREALIVRSTPALLANAPLESFLSDVAEGWREMEEETSAAPDARRLMHAVAATIACHGAIKANQSLTRGEMTHLLESLQARRVAPTCPHGRPVRVGFDRAHLEKLFHRR
jgi:DNA mismatch repair protein MutL